MTIPIAQMTKAEIVALYRWKCKHGHNGLQHYRCWTVEKDTPEKIGFIDIECSNLKADFGIILSWAIKPRGSKDILSDHITKDDLRSGLDKRIVRSCVQAMSGFDRLVGHYSRRYDIPFIRTRAVSLKIPFPQYGEINHTDTYDMARRALCISRYRQDTIARALFGTSHKTRLDSKYWLRALLGDAESIAYILDHNKEDVIELERNYNALEKYLRKTHTSI